MVLIRGKIDCANESLVSSPSIAQAEGSHSSEA